MAPRRWTEIAAAACAKDTASANPLPSDHATANAPLKTSPAATVSTARTRKPGTMEWIPSPETNTPADPIVISTYEGPWSLSFCAARAADRGEVIRTPDNREASASLGVRQVIRPRIEGSSLRAGAGFKRTGTR